MLINCVAYEGGKKLADIQPSEIHSYVCRPECFVWVALFEPTRDELGAMHKQFDLPGLAVEDAFNAALVAVPTMNFKHMPELDALQVPGFGRKVDADKNITRRRQC